MLEEDPLVPVNRWALQREVEKRTPFSMGEFENLIGWSFSMGDAPASKKQLAWDVMRLPRETLDRVQQFQQTNPSAWISRVGDVHDLVGDPGAVGVIVQS
jgi:hypothetical protein